MAYQRNPDDPYRPNREDEFRNAASLDSELQPDPELAEGRTSSGRIALFAVAIAVLLGVVFYGLNNTSINSPGTDTAQTAPASQNTAQTAPPPVPPGVRDVTPRSNNMAPGTTTGAAPARQSPGDSTPAAK